jgi:FtsZ-binding cell division protein ZapB
VSDSFEVLETRVRKGVEEIHLLRKENERLRSQYETLQSQLELMNGDNRKAQRILTEYNQLKRNQEQAAVRVERALQKLSAIRV